MTQAEAAKREASVPDSRATLPVPFGARGVAATG